MPSTWSSDTYRGKGRWVTGHGRAQLRNPPRFARLSWGSEWNHQVELARSLRAAVLPLVDPNKV